MAKLDNIIGGEITIAGRKYTMNEMKLNGAVIWPTSIYRAELIPEWIQYAIIPASGGHVQFRLRYKVYRGSETTPVQEGLIGDPQNANIVLSDSSNFSLSYLTTTVNIIAGNRGRNGITVASGWIAPTNEGARPTTVLSASYVMTHEGQTITATYSGNSFTAVQARNYYRSNGTASYDVTRFSIETYDREATQAPASGGSTKWSADATKTQPYIFDSNATYDYKSSVGAEVTASESVDWLSISGNTITVSGRGTVTGNGRSATITPYIGGTAYPGRAVTLYQQENQIVETVKTYTGASITGLTTRWGTLAANTVPSRGQNGTVSFTAVKNYTSENVYTSGSRAAGPSGSDTATIASGDVIVSAKPTWITAVTDSAITALAQLDSGTSQRSGTLTLRVNYSATGYRTASIILRQMGTVVTYALVCRSHPSGVYLPAYASTVNLVFDGRTSYDNGSPDSVTQGVGVRYSSGSDISGRISHGSSSVSGANLGTTPYNEVSTTYTYAWSSHTEATCAVTVKQSYNRIEQQQEGQWVEGTKTYGTPYQEIQAGSHNITASVTAYGTSESPAPKTGGTTTLSVTARHRERTATPWSRTDTKTDTATWTSRQTSSETTTRPVDGTDYTAYSYVNDSYNVSVDPASMLTVSGNNVTISANSGDARHGLIQVYNANANAWVHIYQKAGNIALSVSVASLSFTSFGGTQTFVVTATSTGWTRALSYTTTRSPFTNGSVTPASGNAGDTTMTVKIVEHPAPIYGSDGRRIGFITFTATEDPDVTAVVRVDQFPAIEDGN